ncbi:hypothetical protein BCD49_08450 [Pseudofrankia sp. EUN1h]|nr:hypothetical protein BCD49_08450 [Pseudofrankia sp. EUN1h]
MPPGSGRNITVSTSDQLTAAIAGARPGDTINLADGTYTGKEAVGKYTGSFSVTTAGTATAPITLRGGRGAVIDGGGAGGHYGLYLVKADYWQIQGISVTNATKGVVLDGSNHVLIDRVRVSNTGQEGVHFRAFSSDNTISNSDVTATGRRSAGYGEGVYIGSAHSNWGTYTGGRPDASDRNKVIGNTFSDTAAENIDIKEGSTGGLIQGNHFDGAGTGQTKDGVRKAANSADSWIDVKGNNYTIIDNTGAHALSNGFEIHNVKDGWGRGNAFHNNTLDVDAYITDDPKHSGFGFWVQNTATGNVVGCDNTVTNAVSGFANVACTPRSS